MLVKKSSDSAATSLVTKDKAVAATVIIRIPDAGTIIRIVLSQHFDRSSCVSRCCPFDVIHILIIHTKNVLESGKVVGLQGACTMIVHQGMRLQQTGLALVSDLKHWLHWTYLRARLSGKLPVCQPDVAAESTNHLSCRPRFRTSSRNKASAMGERQILPKQTIRTPVGAMGRREEGGGEGVRRTTAET